MGSHLVHSSYFSEKPLLWLAAWLFLDSYLWTCALEASEGYKQGFAKKKKEFKFVGCLVGPIVRKKSNRRTWNKKLFLRGDYLYSQAPTMGGIVWYVIFFFVSL
jgi:hypothetical protein